MHVVYHRERQTPRRQHFYRRVFVTYLVTLLSCALVLMAIDRLDPFGDTVVAIKRTILVALPASFSAMVVDSIV